VPDPARVVDEGPRQSHLVSVPARHGPGRRSRRPPAW
jgi:hypothetical protein